ncbi:MAG: Gmad2 immunoglobulin-like domain-containing protein [Propionibacteriales bacterium]|nr:Gmad2 immunoglobulin-like domain-containing protein [Propionibacteriales bacterium]
MTPTNSPYDSGSDATAELLRQALSAEAADVRPAPGALRSIQQRTGAASAPSADPSDRSRRFRAGSTRTSLGGRQPWVFGALGAAVATAAVITAVVVIGDNDKTTPNGAPAATQGTASPSQPTGSEAQPSVITVPVTYVGLPGAARTSRLYTERQLVSTLQSPAAAAVDQFLCCRPPDPDYTTGWPRGIDVGGISSDGSLIRIALEGPSTVQFAPDAELGPDGGQLALQALLRTAGLEPGEQGTVTYNDDPVSVILGVDLPVTVKAAQEVRALISIDNIVDGQEVSNPVTVKVSGNVFEGQINWELLDAKGTKVDDGLALTSMGIWTQDEIKLGSLEPGTYTIRCLEYSPQDGSPGNVDDKSFTVR